MKLARQFIISSCVSLMILSSTYFLSAQDVAIIADESESAATYTLIDDQMLLEAYAKDYRDLTKEILLAMIEDDYLNQYKCAAAIRVFNENYSQEIVAREKRIIEKTLLRRLNRTTSPFVEVEIMYTLCKMDRYRYFDSMIPPLIQKLNHYNMKVNEIAFNNLTAFLESGHARAREARIVFNTLRKMLFLSRNRLDILQEPGPKLAKQLKLLRWAIKILGSQELKRLPKEVIHLL